MGHLRDNGDDGTGYGPPGGGEDRPTDGSARSRSADGSARDSSVKGAARRPGLSTRLRPLRSAVRRGIQTGLRRADGGSRRASARPDDPVRNRSSSADRLPAGFGPADPRPAVRGRGRRAGRPTHPIVEILPGLVIVAGIVLDRSTPTGITASPLFAAAPLLAAPFFSFLRTLVVGIVSIGAVVGLHFAGGGTATIVTVTEGVTVFTVSALALAINGVVRRSGERLASVRVIAETAQRAVLPTPDARIGGLHIAARYEAAEKGAFIGGDLFAVQDTDYGVRLVVGDVRGKGMGAIETVAVVLGAFREAAEQERSLEGVARRLERALTREGTRRSGIDLFEGFTTAVLAEIPHAEGMVRVVNRGHPEPLLFGPDGGLTVLNPVQRALPLGMGELGTWPDRAAEVPYRSGATLLLYTDGLSEARNAAGVFYDPRERLAGRIFPGPDELLEAIVGDVRLHTGGGTTDDMALLAVSRPAERQPERRRTMPVVP